MTSCRHRFCSACATLHVVQHIGLQKFPVRCLAVKCQETLVFDDAKNMKLRADLLSKFEELDVRARFLADATHCSNPKCTVASLFFSRYFNRLCDRYSCYSALFRTSFACRCRSRSNQDRSTFQRETWRNGPPAPFCRSLLQSFTKPFFFCSPLCHFETCASCKVPWHPNMTCEEYQRLDPEKKVKEWRHKTQRCVFFIARHCSCLHCSKRKMHRC